MSGPSLSAHIPTHRPRITTSIPGRRLCEKHYGYGGQSSLADLTPGPEFDLMEVQRHSSPVHSVQTNSGTGDYAVGV